MTLLSSAVPRPETVSLSGWRRFAAVLCAIGMLLVAAPAASAQPDITLDVDAPANVLYGDDATVTLHAANPGTEPYGYNLSFRVVLPNGVSYEPGPVPVEPRVIANAPVPGQTTLIFDNVSDLSPGSSYSLSFDVSHSTATYAIGQSYVVDAGAYINENPRFVPDFTPTGIPDGDYTGSATSSASTRINAIEIEKSEPSPEGELLRGAHDHQTVYTLTVRNNGVEPTSGLVVEDWLPAGLEYLGCGTDDHTDDAPTNPAVSPEEYPGSGPLNPGNAPAAPECEVPDRVETLLTDPDGAGPLPTDVYTHVVWQGLGELAADGQFEIQYVAAVPLRENTTSWTSPLIPAPESLEQGSNLDNNSGDETQDEQALTNYARVSGNYDGTLPVSDDHSITRMAEDLRVLKGVTPGTINQGQISTWSLRIDTSEYRYVNDVRVEDTLPDGLCPLGDENFEGGGDEQAECDPTGDDPSAAYTTVTESSDGSWTIAWDQTTVTELARMQPSSTFTIEFPTKTRASYQQDFEDDEPVRTRDSWENTVDIAGADFRICTPANPEDCTAGGTIIDGDEPNGGDDFDTSAASQQAGGVEIDKTVREAEPTPVNCATGNYVDNATPSYGPGDRVCWQLRVDFASLLDTGQPVVADFIPPGMVYEPGSAVRTGNDTLPSTTFDASGAADGVLTWELGNDVPEDLVFEWRFATVVQQSLGDVEGDLLGNLMKLSYANSEEQTFPLRDEVNVERSQAVLDLVKGVQDVNDDPAGGNPPDTDGATVAEDDVVTFRVDVTNDGDLDAEDAVIWDVLQDGITCSNVPPESISPGGTCSGSRITWTGIDVAAGGSHTLTYDVVMPDGIEPGRTFDNSAGVVSYTSDTNTGGTFTYVPQNNIDPGAPEPNAAAADDTSFVQTRDLTFTKTRTTAVNEAGNNLAAQATIGELVTYTMTLVVPEGTTIYDGDFEDTLGPRHGMMTVFDVTMNGGPLPGAGWASSVNQMTGFYEVNFPGAYSNPPGSGDDTFVFTMAAPLADVPANRRTSPNETVTNTANFDWNDADGTPHLRQPSVSTTVVEPNVAVQKNEDDADDIVSPGQALTYTVTAINQSGTPVSTAHDLELVDEVPEGLTPDLPIPGGGVWDPGARTITWTIPSLNPGQSALRTYAVTVDDPATAGSVFPNTADLTATSMAGAVSGERTPISPVTAGYVASTSDTVRLSDATLTKGVSPTSATVGDDLTYTVDVTFPGSITYYDATVIDTLPDGVDFDGTVSVTCDGGACSPAVVPLAAEPQPDGSTRIAWFLDDLPNQPAARNYTITYSAHVDDSYVPPAPVSGGQSLTNVAGAFYNGDDQIIGVPGPIPPSGTFEDGSGPDDATVQVVEPLVSIDKNVSGDPDADDARPTQPGDSYTYSLVVRNLGTSPAYDVEVTDTPDETLLRNIVVADNTAATETDSDGSDGTLGWTIPGPLDPNESVTLTYTADLAPSADLNNGETVVNTADVPLYWGVPLAERIANPLRDYRQYTNVPDDTVTLTVHLPQLAVVKTTGGPGFPDSAVAQVGEPFPWRVVVQNTSTQAIAESVDVSDELPPNWTYVPGSASFAPGGAAEPTITPAPGGDTLTWQNRGDLAPGGQMVLTFQARPTVAAIANGTGAGSPHVNVVIAGAEDASGANGSADGFYRDQDTAQAIVELPDLDVDKTPDGDTVDAGDDATYDVVVSNTGPVPARDVVVRDVLGAGQTYTPGTATMVPEPGFSESSVTPGPGAGETTIEWRIDQIPAGGSVTITLPVETDSSLPEGTDLVNDASVTSREIATAVEDDGSYETTVESDVGIVKTAQAAPVNAGEEMDFTMRVTNHGPSDATGVGVADVLPANLEFVSATTPACRYSTAMGAVLCDIFDLAAGDSVDLTLRVRVDPDETVGVSNTATVASTTPDTNQNNNSSTANKPVDVAANVRVEKTAPTEPVLQGTSFDYVIRVENAGVSAATDVTLSDDLPAGVEFESLTPDPGPCSESGGTIDCAFGTMQPGDSAEVGVRVLPVDVGTPLNTAVVDTPTNETSTNDNQSSAPVEIVPTADLAVTKTAPATAAPGTEIDYELEVVNNGPSPATGVSVVDTLPAGMQFVSADPECSNAAGVVTCDAGDLAVSASRSFTITVAIPFALGGQTLTNTAVVAGNEGDLVPENDSDEATTEVEPAADLAISKTAGGATAGETATWTLVVRNHGPSTGDPVTVADTLPAGTTFASASPSQGSCSGAGADLSCNLGALASGGSAQISVTATVAADIAGRELRNRATVSAPQVDPDPSNNAAESVTTVAAPAPGGPNVSLTKTASTARPELGKPFRYRLLVENKGDQAAEHVRVVDTLNKSVRLRKVTTSAGRCSEDGSTVECSIRTLAPGAEAAITLTVVPTDPGRLRNAASATIRGGGDTRPADNGDVAGVQVRALATRLGVSKTAARSSVRGGETVRFRIAVSTSRRAVADAWVCDKLPAGLVFVRARGATFRNGQACWRWGYMGTGARRVVHVIARAERGFTRRNVRNVAVAAAMNARRQSDAARVQVDPAFGGVGGGVTG